MRLFVKNVSADHDSSSLKSVFSRYGRVLKILPDLKRRNVTYVVSEEGRECEGGGGKGGRGAGIRNDVHCSRNWLVQYMDVEGGNKAINNLHGKAISKNGKPLIVELSYEVSHTPHY